MTTPEHGARLRIDELLAAAGWSVQDYMQSDLHATRGVAIREFELNAGFGTADYLLYVDGKAAVVIEAKKEARRSPASRSSPRGTPKDYRPAFLCGAGRCPLSVNQPAPRPFSPTGSTPSRARSVFAFHRAGILAEWLEARISGFIPLSRFLRGEFSSAIH